MKLAPPGRRRFSSISNGDKRYEAIKTVRSGKLPRSSGALRGDLPLPAGRTGSFFEPKLLEERELLIFSRTQALAGLAKYFQKNVFCIVDLYPAHSISQ